MKALKKVKRLPYLIRIALVVILRCWGWTIRRRVDDPQGILSGKGEPCLFALWHCQLIALPMMLSKMSELKLGILASKSRDGGYIADLLEGFGLVSVRGSSSKGGAMALRQMMRLVQQGVYIGLTPDGPRGPRCEVQAGIVYMAGRLQCPLVPIAITMSSSKALKSWDRTQIPLPFSTMTFRVGTPIQVPKNLEDEQQQVYQDQLRDAMQTLSDTNGQKTPQENMQTAQADRS